MPLSIIYGRVPLVSGRLIEKIAKNMPSISCDL
jgi:hypothetical protein